MYEFLKLSFDRILECKGTVRFLHNEKNEQGSAYTVDERIVIEIALPRTIGAVCVSFIFFDADSGDKILEKDAEWQRIEYSCDVYRVRIKRGRLKLGVYNFTVKINAILELYAYKIGSELAFCDSLPYDMPHITVSEFIYARPTRYGGIIYHVFVDRFSRGKKWEKREGSILYSDWNTPIEEFPPYPGAPLKNNTFYGGDLYGIINKLDYLLSLGVSLIYLSPIFSSPSNHRYDTSDYMSVDGLIGGDKGFLKLIRECNKRDIGIILDGVFNHTGSDSIYFNKNGSFDTVGAYQSKESVYFTWYTFYEWPRKYECWWNIDILPRINHSCNAVSEFFLGKGGVIDKYSSLGIVGFRLDVADELSDGFIEKTRSILEENVESPLLYGEVWEDASKKYAYGKLKKYYLGRELDGVMNYPLREGIISYIKYGNVEKLRYSLEVLLNMPKRIRDATMNILGTHDTARIITVLGDGYNPNRENNILALEKMPYESYLNARAYLMCAYTVISTLPGIVSVYYGDEVGVEGYSDPFNRRSFPWGKEDATLLEHYRKVGKIRRENDVYADGIFKVMHLDRELFIFQREKNGSSYVTVYNNGFKSISVIFKGKANELLSNNVAQRHLIKPKTASIFRSKSKNNSIIINPDEF